MYFVYLHAIDSRGNSHIGQNMGKSPSTELPGFKLNKVHGNLLTWGFYLKSFESEEEAKTSLAELHKQFPWGNNAPYRVNDRHNAPRVMSKESLQYFIDKYGIQFPELKF